MTQKRFPRLLALMMTLVMTLSLMTPVTALAASVPAAPAISITTKAASGKPSLKWKAVSKAVKYAVYRSNSKTGTFKKMLTTTSTSYTNTSAVAGKTYYYKVKALNKSGKGTFSKVKYITCDCARPVVSVTTVASTGKPRLTWKAVDGAAKYEVWRATSKSGTYKKIKTTTSTKLTNTSAVAGKTYYYKVKAICGKSSYGDSAFSAVKSITCLQDTSDIIMSTADLDRLCAEANAYAESLGMKIDTNREGWGTGYPVWMGESSYSDALHDLKGTIKHHHEGVAGADTTYVLVWYQSGGAFGADYEVCVGGA